jgi:hypothetical protein
VFTGGNPSGPLLQYLSVNSQKVPEVSFSDMPSPFALCIFIQENLYLRELNSKIFLNLILAILIFILLPNCFMKTPENCNLQKGKDCKN